MAARPRRSGPDAAVSARPARAGRGPRRRAPCRGLVGRRPPTFPARARAGTRASRPTVASRPRAPGLLAGSRGKFLWPGGRRRGGAGAGRRPDPWPGGRAGARRCLEDSPAGLTLRCGATGRPSRGPTRTCGDAPALALAGEGPPRAPAARLSRRP